MSMVIRAAGKLVFACALALALWTGSAQALSLQQIGSFDEPIFLASDPGNPERLFVAERDGVVVKVENGSTTTFADVRLPISCCGGEQGLLSIALSPDFDQSGRFFLDYTGEEEPGEIHVAEMVAPPGGGSAPLSSLRNLLTIPHPEDSNHYGGQLQFGPEGDLFISTGDGGGSNDEHHNAQNLETLLGKILRIDPDPAGVLPYTIPAGNPFAGKAGRDEIWAYGLRNPFRFSFDLLTGALTIGDVGQDAREEVDYAPAPGLGAGANYGWNCREGFIKGPATDEPACKTTPPGGFAEPIFDYPHTNPEDGGAWGEAIIGGYVARGPGLGDVYGRYLYGDYGTGELRSFLPSDPFGTDRDENLNIENLNSFGEDSCGRLYAISGNGPVYRLVGPGDSTCPGTASPPPVPSFVGIRAVSRRVLRHHRALISVWVAPCEEKRRGNPVSLWRGRQLIGTRHLDRVCSARFRPRISRSSGFRATIKAIAPYEAATSRKLTIKPRHRHRH